MGDRTKLYCFPCAGGTAAFYDPLGSYMDPSVDVVKLEYAGHGSRHRERPYTDFSELAEDMYRQIRFQNKRDGAYALLGYSMGCISAVETLKLILRYEEISPPAHIFLAAHAPYGRKELEGFDENTPDEWVKDRTIRFGGIPETLIGNEVFWRAYLPLYRADYLMIGKYDFHKIDLVSEIPATVFFSQTDTPYTQMTAWKRFFIGECDFYGFEGNHFFIYENEQRMAEMIKDRLFEKC